MAPTFPKLMIAAFFVCAWPFDVARAHAPNSGITISLLPQSLMPPGAIVCTGVCSRGRVLDVTVWSDGRVNVDGRDQSRISKAIVARFRSILLPFRPVGNFEYADPSVVMPKTCYVKIQWPADHRGRRTACGDYDSRTEPESLFVAAMRALQVINVDTSMPGMSCREGDFRSKADTALRARDSLKGTLVLRCP
jgi:hypothetical protein